MDKSNDWPSVLKNSAERGAEKAIAETALSWQMGRGLTQGKKTWTDATRLLKRSEEL